MKIGVIGCGKMAQSLVKGIHNENKNIEFHTYTPSFTRAHELAEVVKGYAHKDINEFPKINMWIIACKPQQFDDLVFTLGGLLRDEVVISIMAAINLVSIQDKLDSKKIVRIMPNTPSLIGYGISLILYSTEIEIQTRVFVKDMFTSVGKVFSCETEKQFDELTVISGSGPAYVFEYANSYLKAALKMGLSEDEARQMINQLFLGASKLITESASSLDSMISDVTSKGGVTIEAISELRESNINEVIEKSLNRAVRHSKQMTQEYSK